MDLIQYDDKRLMLKSRKPTIRGVQEQRSLEGFIWTIKSEGQNAKEEEGRNMQKKKKKDAQIKYSLAPHSIHYTNSAGRINGGMTPEQYLHSLQHVPPPPTKP